MSGGLVLALAMCVAYYAFGATAQGSVSLWVAAPCVAFAVAYCIPWGIFERSTPAEEAEAAQAAEAGRQ